LIGCEVSLTDRFDHRARVSGISERDEANCGAVIELKHMATVIECGIAVGRPDDFVRRQDSIELIGGKAEERVVLPVLAVVAARTASTISAALTSALIGNRCIPLLSNRRSTASNEHANIVAVGERTP
jgi:hypothetical protein